MSWSRSAIPPTLTFRRTKMKSADILREEQSVCILENCSGNRRVNGYCITHYERMRYGNAKSPIKDYYYVYIYYGATGKPYYVGKGQGSRAWNKHHTKSGKCYNPPESENIIIVKDNMSEEDAFALEEKLILEYGRRDIEDDGILLNRCGGGQGQTDPRTFKPVIQYCRFTGDEVSRYVSIAEASRNTGMFGTAISACCNLRNNRAGDYIFRYEGEDGNPLEPLPKYLSQKILATCVYTGKFVGLFNTPTDIMNRYEDINSNGKVSETLNGIRPHCSNLVLEYTAIFDEEYYIVKLGKTDKSDLCIETTYIMKELDNTETIMTSNEAVVDLNLNLSSMRRKLKRYGHIIHGDAIYYVYNISQLASGYTKGRKASLAMGGWNRKDHRVNGNK